MNTTKFFISPEQQEQWDNYTWLAREPWLFKWSKSIKAHQVYLEDMVKTVNKIRGRGGDHPDNTVITSIPDRELWKQVCTSHPSLMSRLTTARIASDEAGISHTEKSKENVPPLRELSDRYRIWPSSTPQDHPAQHQSAQHGLTQQRCQILSCQARKFPIYEILSTKFWDDMTESQRRQMARELGPGHGSDWKSEDGKKLINTQPHRDDWRDWYNIAGTWQAEVPLRSSPYTIKTDSGVNSVLPKLTDNKAWTKRNELFSKRSECGDALLVNLQEMVQVINTMHEHSDWNDSSNDNSVQADLWEQVNKMEPSLLVKLCTPAMGTLDKDLDALEEIISLKYRVGRTSKEQRDILVQHKITFPTAALSKRFWDDMTEPRRWQKARELGPGYGSTWNPVKGTQLVEADSQRKDWRDWYNVAERFDAATPAPVQSYISMGFLD